MRAWVLVVSSILVAGCTSRLATNVDIDDGDGGSSMDTGVEVGESSSTHDTGATRGDDDDNADPGEDGWGEDGDDGCRTFLGCDDDVPPPPEMCDFWAQDCPTGEKCTAIASTPGNPTWDANVCVPAGDGAVGEPCTTADGPQGADTCDGVSLCHEIDPSTGVGTCVGFCLAPEASPNCPEGSGPHAECRKTSNPILNLCLGSCNPLLAGECAPWQVCVAAFEGQKLGGFICYPPADDGISGEECGCANCCAEHHMCVPAEDYGPDCAFDICCTEYCDTEDPSFVCQGTDQVCVALFDPNTPEFGNVGRCVLP